MNSVIEIKQATALWNEKRWNHKKVKKLLTNGSFFKITREEYDSWKAAYGSVEYIHAYPAIFGKDLHFVVIDSETDKNTFTEESLKYTFVKSFTDDYDVNAIDFIDHETDGNIKVTEALKRVMQWNLMLESWLKDQIDSFKDDQVGVFRVFNIPFGDLEKSFANAEVKEVVLNFGLRKREPKEGNKSIYAADLLVWSVSERAQIQFVAAGISDPEGDAPVDDLVFLCPPWNEQSINEYNLVNP